MYERIMDSTRSASSCLSAPEASPSARCWRVGKAHCACIVARDAAADVQPDTVRRLPGMHGELVHVTVEVDRPLPARATA
ncbi:Uncharacterised protein [Delftia tsuruhatensis]|uniref:hypothetical protein n=1 Tax=Delftia tsuruhatensis TaxID=180282 RepID=UPI001E7D6D06|nr:hypothetical protein [Delftia tsuruhatensis]CAB5721933.1 Uncharacterised protein [Delftia tsuruhatensis]CAC9681861.1 Uncharacterised protein [Delftia tsuruhatensis]